MRQRKLAALRGGTSHLSFHRMHLLIYIAQRFTIASNLRENEESCGIQIIQCCESEGNMIRDFALQTRGNSNPVLDTFSASEARVTRRMEPSRPGYVIDNRWLVVEDSTMYAPEQPSITPRSQRAVVPLFHNTCSASTAARSPPQPDIICDVEGRKHQI